MQIGLEKALEVALFKPILWEFKGYDLPPIQSDLEAPPVFYTSRVLVDLYEGKVIWAKSDPLVEPYLLNLHFMKADGGERYRFGYLTTGPRDAR